MTRRNPNAATTQETDETQFASQTSEQSVSPTTQAPESSSSESTGDKEIQPVAKPESQDGKATFDTNEETVTVKLNDLNSDSDKGDSKQPLRS